VHGAIEFASTRPSLPSRSRRQLLAGALAMVICGTGVAQQGYPSRVVSFKSAMAPGSTTDVLARELAKSLGDRLGQVVIVEPVLGSGGLIAAQRVLNSAADGYTLLFSSNSLISGQAMRKQPPVDVSRDLVLVSPVVEGYFGLYVNPELPAKTLEEFIAYAKARPGQLNYGSSGVGGIVHLVGEDFRMRTGLDLVHVPYKGTAEMMPELLGNRIQFTFADTTIMQPHVDSGKLRLLAVSSAKRLPQLPAVPTFVELGLRGYTPTFWYGIYAPRGTPAAVVERVNAEMKVLLTSPDAQQRFADRGYHTIWLPPAEAQRKIADELSVLNKTIDASKIERQ
jgi:tripartite-type tricarboxylate transporter receptor subunit TctC